MAFIPASQLEFAASFDLSGVRLVLHSDTTIVAEEFASVFGRSSGADVGRFGPLVASVSTPAENPVGRLDLRGDDCQDPAGFLLSFSSPTIPLQRAHGTDESWALLTLGDDPEPVFALRDGECLFRRVPRWPRIIANILFLRLLGLRPDLLFLHAATVDVHGRGVLLSGPKGSGKTTLSLALASRGHPLLGDETAAYSPDTGEVLPFQRPAAIKPGRRSRVVEEWIDAHHPSADEDGILRVGVEAFQSRPVAPVPLSAVVYLDGFGERPRIERFDPGSADLGRLQPLGSSLVGDGVAKRVFAMIKLLSGSRGFRLVAGDPDETAALLERELAH